MADFLAALMNEIAELEGELRANPKFLKWERLKSVLDLYQNNGLAREDLEGASQPRTVTRVPSEARVQALNLARFFLRNRSGPTPTREIYDHVIAHGAEIGGKDPISNLSAMLSNSDEFQSNGRAGWTLVPENGQQPIDDTVYTTVAESVLADLTSEQLGETHSFVTTHRKVPQDIDAHLLGEAREKTGRFLTDKESANLRSVFTELLKEHAILL